MPPRYAKKAGTNVRAISRLGAQLGLSPRDGSRRRRFRPSRPSTGGVTAGNLQIRRRAWTSTLPAAGATFLPPFQGLFPDFAFTQGLRPGLQSVAASRLIDCETGHCGQDVTDITMRSQPFLCFPKWRGRTGRQAPARLVEIALNFRRDDLALRVAFPANEKIGRHSRFFPECRLFRSEVGRWRSGNRKLLARNFGASGRKWFSCCAPLSMVCR